MSFFVDCFGGRRRSVPISSPQQPQLDERFVCRALEAARIQDDVERRKEDERRKRRAQLEAETPALYFSEIMRSKGADEKVEKKEEEKKLLAELIRSEWGLAGGFFKA